MYRLTWKLVISTRPALQTLFNLKFWPFSIGPPTPDKLLFNAKKKSTHFYPLSPKTARSLFFPPLSLSLARFPLLTLLSSATVNAAPAQVPAPSRLPSLHVFSLSLFLPFSFLCSLHLPVLSSPPPYHRRDPVGSTVVALLVR